MSKINSDKRILLNDAAVQNALKDVYMPVIQQETFYNAGTLSQAFGEKGIGQTVNDMGNGLQTYINKGTTGSHGAMKDGMTFNRSSGYVGGDKFTVTSRAFQGGITLVEETMLRTQNDTASFVDWFGNQIADTTKDLKRSWGRQLYGTSEGVITTVRLVAIIDKSVDTDNKAIVKIPVVDVRKFKIGDVVSFEGAATSGWESSAFKVIDVDYQGGVIVIDAVADNGTGASISGTTPAGVVVAGTLPVVDLTDASIYYNLSKDGEFHGLKDLLSDRNYFGIGTMSYDDGTNITTYPTKEAASFKEGTLRPSYLRPIVTKVHGFANEEVLMKHRDDQDDINGENACDFMVTSKSTIRSYASNPNFKTNRINRDSTSSAKDDVRSQGYRGIDFLGDEIFADRMADHSRIHFLSLENLDMVMLQDLTWDDKVGTMWKQSTNSQGRSQLAWTANMYAWKDIYSNQPAMHGYVMFTNEAGDVEENPKVQSYTFDGTTIETIFRNSAPLGTKVNPDGSVSGSDGTDVMTDSSVSVRTKVSVNDAVIGIDESVTDAVSIHTPDIDGDPATPANGTSESEPEVSPSP